MKLLEDNIFDVQHSDPRFKNVKVVLVTPQDSRSGINNPVEYILHEGDGELMSSIGIKDDLFIIF